jgi:hypothetical protein
MVLRTIIIAALTFLAGALSYAVVDSARSARPSAHSTASDWEAVKHYRAFVLNSANSRPDPKTGLQVTTPPPDPGLNLAALVAAGELEHVDLVLPNVANSRAANRFWMKWAEENPDILHALGNPTYTAFAPSGTAPLHLQLWFRESATATVQQLIQDLEHLPAEGA